MPGRRDEHRSVREFGTFTALIGMLLAAGGLLLLCAMVLPQLLAVVWVVGGFVSFVALHYVLWGQWLSQTGVIEDDEDL